MIEVKESLPTFNDALLPKSLNRCITQNDYIFNKYRVEVMQKNMVNDLQEVNDKKNRRKIHSVPFYNIQFIDNYIKDFCYIGPHVENREKMINLDPDETVDRVSPDFVTIFLNLSAIPDSVVERLDMSDDFTINLSRQMDKYFHKNPMRKYGESIGYLEWVNYYLEHIKEKKKEEEELK